MAETASAAKAGPAMPAMSVGNRPGTTLAPAQARDTQSAQEKQEAVTRKASSGRARVQARSAAIPSASPWSAGVGPRPAAP